MFQRAILPNGMRIICETIPQVHSVSLGVWVGTGSRYEDLKNNGISHFIEHMLFKGTSSRSARDIAETIDAVGGQLNAFTTKEYTCFYAKVLAQHFELGVDLLADMLTNSTFAPEEIEKEKQVVLEEIKSYEDAPDELIHDILADTILKGHPLGWTILGSPESVGRIDQAAIISYLKQYYTPDNMVFAVAGNVQFDQIVADVTERFAGLSGFTRQELPPVPPVEQSVVARHKDIEQVHLCLGARGLGRQDPDKYTVFVLDSILGGSVSSRLFQQLREERGLVYVAGTNHASYKDTGIFSIYAGTSLENFEKVISLIKRELNQIQRVLVEPAELARAKDQLKGNLLLSLESTCNRMSRIGKTELFRDQLLTPEESVARIDKVTSEGLLRVASRIFGEGRIVLTALGPFPKNSKVFTSNYNEY